MLVPGVQSSQWIYFNIVIGSATLTKAAKKASDASESDYKHTINYLRASWAHSHGRRLESVTL